MERGRTFCGPPLCLAPWFILFNEIVPLLLWRHHDRFLRTLSDGGTVTLRNKISELEQMLAGLGDALDLSRRCSEVAAGVQKSWSRDISETVWLVETKGVSKRISETRTADDFLWSTSWRIQERGRFLGLLLLENECFRGSSITDVFLVGLCFNDVIEVTGTLGLAARDIGRRRAGFSALFGVKLLEDRVRIVVEFLAYLPALERTADLWLGGLNRLEERVIDIRLSCDGGRVLPGLTFFLLVRDWTRRDTTLSELRLTLLFRLLRFFFVSLTSPWQDATEEPWEESQLFLRRDLHSLLTRSSWLLLPSEWGGLKMMMSSCNTGLGIRL